MFANQRTRDWKTNVWRDLDVQLHLLDAGLSCKDLSSLSGNQTRMLPYIWDALKRLDVVNMELPIDMTLQGTTLPTLLGVVQCILKTRPWIVVLENVVARQQHQTRDV